MVVVAVVVVVVVVVGLFSACQKRRFQWLIRVVYFCRCCTFLATKTGRSKKDDDNTVGGNEDRAHTA